MRLCTVSRLTNGCAWNAVSAFANCGVPSHTSGAAMYHVRTCNSCSAEGHCYSIVAWLGVSTRSGHVEAELTAHDQSLAMDGTEIIAV